MSKKICICCKKELPLSEFNKKGSRLHSYCKSCLYRYFMRRWNQKKRDAIQWMGGKCEICGKSDLHPVEFDFHHDRDKQDTWTKLRLKSWDKIKKELAKCRLLCVGCHRKEHINKDLW